MARALQGDHARAREVLEERRAVADGDRATQRGRPPLGLPRPEPPRRGPGQRAERPRLAGVHLQGDAAARRDARDHPEPRAGLAYEVMPDTQTKQVVELGYGATERILINMGPQHRPPNAYFRMIDPLG